MSMPDHKKLVLLIDDERDFIFFVKRNLELSGFRAIVAHDGGRGLRLAQRIRPDVILLDIRMPGIDGFEVLRRLKADNHTIAIPVIMFSALGDETTQVRASGLYDDDFIVKPAEIATIRSRIEHTLSHATGTGTYH
jgi:DNA-binding response OmpR family regulator